MSCASLAYLNCSKCGEQTLHNRNTCTRCGATHAWQVKKRDVITFNNQLPEQNAKRVRRLKARQKAGLDLRVYR